MVTITPAGTYLVLIGVSSGASGALAAEALPAPRRAPAADAASPSALRDALLRYADPPPPGLTFELDHLSSLRSGQAVAVWTLQLLDLTGLDLLEIYAMPATALIPILLDRPDHGVLFHPAET